MPVLGHAQEARSVRCRLLGFGGSGAAESVLNLSDTGAETICPLPRNSMSPRFVFSATNNKVTFLSSADKKPVAVATIPSQVKAAILVFVKGVKGSSPGSKTLPWRVVVIEDSLENFPDGGAYVANFHNQDIRFIIGEHKGMLRPAGSNGYAQPTKRDSFNMAPVVFEFLQGDKWRTASESGMRFLPGMRYLMFAYTDPVSGRLRINTCQDFKSLVSEPAKP
jgi:hypothetical protein